MNYLIKNNIQDLLPLTSLQEGLLFHYLHTPLKNHYQQLLIIDLGGDIDIRRLREAWQVLVAGNELLRTVYKWKDIKKPIQIILKKMEIPMEVHDLTMLHSDEQKGCFESIKHSFSTTLLDLSSNPLKLALIVENAHATTMLIRWHHILFDGWSNSVLLKELQTVYESLMIGRQPTIPYKTPLKQFIKRANAEAGHNHHPFWQEYLRGFQLTSGIPHSFESINAGKSDKVTEKFTLPECVWRIMGDVCSANGITRASIVYAAWGILLSRYSDMKDIVFGVALSGRDIDLEGIEDMIGLCINTLPIRISFHPEDKSIDLIQSVSNSLKLMSMHQHVSLVKLKSYSSLDNNSSLFDTLVTYENYPIDNNLMNESKVLYYRGVELHETNNYPISLSVIQNEGLQFIVSYDVNIYSRPMIKAMSNHLIQIIDSMVTNLNASVSKIEMLTDAEKKTIIQAFNCTKLDDCLNQTIVDRFKHQVRLTPDRVAVRFQSEDMTFRELNNNVNRLGNILRQRGVQTGSIVAIMMDKSIEMVISMLGVLNAGAAYLPIDPDFPSNRIQFMIKDSKPGLLITSAACMREVGDLDLGAEVVVIDEIGRAEGNEPEVAANFNEEDIAYVMYTSGSTGTPKGVMIRHRNVVNFFIGMNEILEPKGDETLLSVTTFSFDISVLEMLWTLTQGVQVVLNHKNTIELDNFDVFISDSGESEGRSIDILQCTPSRLKILLTDPKSTRFLSRLRKIIVGGESLPLYLVKKIREVTDAKTINVYGPTETTVWSSSYVVEDDAVLIGKPIANTVIYLLDSNLTPVPISVPGEIYIGGEGLAKGYLNREELTEERFITVDHLNGYSERLYKTGDIGRYTPQGLIEYIGRRDFQVKIRGHRVELEEVSEVLMKYEGMSDGAVIKSGNNSLTVFFVADKKINSSALREYLEQYLPEYMVPSGFIQLTDLPLTPNGKTDHKALMELHVHDETTTVVELADEIEIFVRAVWIDLLERGDIGINQNFFEVGGNSILLMQMSNILNKQYLGHFTVAELFSHPTVSQMASFIRDRLGSKMQDGQTIRTVAFPLDFFCSNSNLQEEEIPLRHEISAKENDLLQRIAENEKIAVQSILISALMYLFSEMTNEKEFTIYVASESNIVSEVQVSLENTTNMMQLFSKVEDATSHHNNILHLQFGSSSGDVKRSGNRASVLFFEKDQYDVTKGEGDFDFLIGLCENSQQVYISCHYNCSLLKGAKVAAFFENYIQLVNAILEHYEG